MKISVYSKLRAFKTKYPFTISWRLMSHAKVINKHLTDDEKVLYAFAAQKNDHWYDVITTYAVVLTNKRIIIGTKRLVFGYFFYRKNILTISLASAGELLVLSNYLLFNKIDVKNILFWSDNVSLVIKTVIQDMSSKIYFLGFSFIITAIIIEIVYYITRKNKVR